MTSIQEYIKMGIKRKDLVPLLEKAHKTKNKPIEERLYVGILNKTEPGSSVLKAGKPVLLRTIKDRTGVHFVPVGGKALWYTGNNNVTLSPWDAGELAKQEYKNTGKYPWKKIDFFPDQPVAFKQPDLPPSVKRQLGLGKSKLKF